MNDLATRRIPRVLHHCSIRLLVMGLHFRSALPELRNLVHIFGPVSPISEMRLTLLSEGGETHRISPRAICRWVRCCRYGTSREWYFSEFLYCHPYVSWLSVTGPELREATHIHQLRIRIRMNLPEECGHEWAVREVFDALQHRMTDYAIFRQRLAYE